MRFTAFPFFFSLPTTIGLVLLLSFLPPVTSSSNHSIPSPLSSTSTTDLSSTTTTTTTNSSISTARAGGRQEPTFTLLPTTTPSPDAQDILESVGDQLLAKVGARVDRINSTVVVNGSANATSPAETTDRFRELVASSSQKCKSTTTIKSRTTKKEEKATTTSSSKQVLVATTSTKKEKSTSVHKTTSLPSSTSTSHNISSSHNTTTPKHVLTTTSSTTKSHSHTTTATATLQHHHHTSPTTASESSTHKKPHPTTTTRSRPTTKPNHRTTTTSKHKSTTTTKKKSSPTAVANSSSGTSFLPLPCVPPSPTFEGTEEGFENLCKRRFCAANATKRLVWSGNEGDVKRSEIETALGMFAAVDPIPVDNVSVGNSLSDGVFGQAAQNAGILFEITGDIRALDLAVKYADNILAIRNDPINGSTLWDGVRELMWPTGASTDHAYAGSENGDIVAHLTMPSVYILKSPCLWGMVPEPYDGPSAFDPSDTYLTRALAFVKAGDECIEYFTAHWFDENWLAIQPNDTRYLLVNDTGNLPGTPMPWNRRTLLLHGFLTLAAAHETLPAYDPVKVWYYDMIIQRNILDFYKALNATQAKTGEPTWIWYYVDKKKNIEEGGMGIHGYYDAMGVWWAYQRNPKLYQVTDNITLGLANTMQFSMNLGNSTVSGPFSGLVNGLTPKGTNMEPSLWASWSYYALWLPTWGTTMFNASVKQGFNGRTWLAIPLLYTKHAISLNSTSFWRGSYASGHGYIPGTSKSSASLEEVLKAKMRIGARSGEGLNNLRAITSGSSKGKWTPTRRKVIGVTFLVMIFAWSV